MSRGNIKYKGWQASHTIGRQTNTLYTQLSIWTSFILVTLKMKKIQFSKFIYKMILNFFSGWLNTRVVFRVKAVVTDSRVLKKGTEK